jgi:hypothetical protein
LVSAVRAAQIAEMRAAAARMREMVEARRAAARARYREQQLTGRGGSGDFEDTTSTRAIEFGRRMRFGMEGAGYPPELTLDELEQVRSDARARGEDEIEAVRAARRARATARWEAYEAGYSRPTPMPSYIPPSPAEVERTRVAIAATDAARRAARRAGRRVGRTVAEAEAATRAGRRLNPGERGFIHQNVFMLGTGIGGSGDIEDTAPTGEPESDDSDEDLLSWLARN